MHGWRFNDHDVLNMFKWPKWGCCTVVITWWAAGENVLDCKGGSQEKWSSGLQEALLTDHNGDVPNGYAPWACTPLRWWCDWIPILVIPILAIPILAIPILAMSSRNLTSDTFKKKVPKMTDSDILQGVPVYHLINGTYQQRDQQMDWQGHGLTELGFEQSSSIFWMIRTKSKKKTNRQIWLFRWPK
jgi:hypothetical protein